MGVPSGGGASLGGASGRITIDVTQLAAAQQAVLNASRQMTAAMNQISPAAQNAQRSLSGLNGGVGSLTDGISQLDRFLGASLLLGLGATFARQAIELDRVATAYRRQNVAALSLAGSQEQLNDLLQIYQRVSGGAVDSATALANVSQLMSVGFADSVEELDRFATAIRGISIARGVSQDFVTQNLILELFSQRGARLDQLGLQYDKVRQRADQLRAADRNLTQEMAYQQAVLDLAIERYGTLTRSAEGAATGMELAARMLSEARREIGETISPLTNIIGNFVAATVLLELGKLQAYVGLIEKAADAWERLRQAMGFTPNVPATAAPAAPSGGSIGRGPRFTDDQTAAMVDWHRSTLEIERQAARDRLDATRQYERQRSDTIRQYEQSIAREAEDFALSRLRAEQDYAISLQRMHRDIAQREATQLADLERTIADARTDAAERASERQIALDERIAETRAQSNERIAELESDFARRRERAQRDHAERLRDAAANLDAVAVREAQRDFRNSQRDAQEDFDERIGKERQNEAKRLEELNKAHAKQTADEGRALQRRIDDANAAYQRQLEDARAADAQRIEDMAADFALRQERENEDRGIRLERLQQDHNDQLAEQAAQHELRLIQIAEQEQEERALLDEEFQEELRALNIRIDAYTEKLKGYETAAIEAFDRVWGHWLGAMQGPQPQIPLPTPWSGPVFGGGVPPVSSSMSSSTRTVNIAPGAVIITEAARPGQTKQEVWEALIELMDEMR